MTNEQCALILQSISDARQESSENIAALSKEFAEFKGTITTTVAAHDKYIDGEKKWGRIKTLAMPLYAIGHGFLSHWGVKI
jgi:hypothetical protein